MRGGGEGEVAGRGSEAGGVAEYGDVGVVDLDSVADVSYAYLVCVIEGGVPLGGAGSWYEVGID